MQTITILPMIDIGTHWQGWGTTMLSGSETSQARVRALNDALRMTFAGGRVMLTRGVEATSGLEKAAVLQAVRTFSNFASDNDPYGEHDFGRVVVAGVGYFWKIDYYDQDYRYQSPDPADEAVTARVMTIMREGEY